MRAAGKARGSCLSRAVPEGIEGTFASADQRVPHIFAIGDIVGQPMLAHKAVHEAPVPNEGVANERHGDKVNGCIFSGTHSAARLPTGATRV